MGQEIQEERLSHLGLQFIWGKAWAVMVPTSVLPACKVNAV